YLARHLVDLGYRVVGTVRPGATDVRRVYLDGVEVVELEQRDRAGFGSLLDSVRPAEVYNLAGFTSVGASWKHAETVAETNGLAVLRMLEELV
ncbi:NAD-dependent epimerase/dehydratase family protein, partial [Escherichia coli]|nr:NAD-dependent epimerase/dehydratase family protein [Escherichia coli]